MLLVLLVWKFSLILKNDGLIKIGHFLSIQLILEVSDPGLVYALYHKFLMTLVSLNIHPEVWSCVTFSHLILENRKEAMMGGRNRWYRPTVTLRGFSKRKPQDNCTHWHPVGQSLTTSNVGKCSILQAALTS